MLADNCADEHVCGKKDFDWLPLTAGKDPKLQVADGRPLRYYGDRAVPLWVDNEREVTVIFKVVDVTQPILSVGKFNMRHQDRGAWFDGSCGELYDEKGGRISLTKIQNHYAMYCWATPQPKKQKKSKSEVSTCYGSTILAPIMEEDEVQAQAEPDAPVLGPAQQAPAPRQQMEVVQDIAPEGAVAIPREGLVEPEVRARGIMAPTKPSAEEIERHNLTHDPPMPWCEVCV